MENQTTDSPAKPATGTGLVVNPSLLLDDDSPQLTNADLPAGVYLEGSTLPEGRVELFRVNGRLYTVPTAVDPRIMFRFVRALRQRKQEELAMADMLYDVLGSSIIDFLADEGLAPEETAAVMKAVSKYTMSAMNRAGLGN